MDNFKPFFDEVLKKFREKTPERVKEALEKRDKELKDYLISDEIMRSRFKNIGIRERTLLTTIGIVSFKRHYFYDKQEKEYFFPLDMILQIPKRVKMSNELKVDIFKKYMSMNYTGIIREYKKYFDISRSSICRIIHNTKLKSSYPKIHRKIGDIVHIQIDEKYVNVRGYKNQIRLYTATIFCGCSFYMKKIHNEKKIVKNLDNVFVLSSFNIKDLKEKIDDYLRHAYNCTWFSDFIYVSGDFAPYIRNLASNLDVQAIYVPDKWHVFHILDKYLPELNINESSLQSEILIKEIAFRLSKVNDINANNLSKILYRNPFIFKPYVSDDYLGCSQEGYNARIYAQKFSKKFSKFNKQTIEKIVLALECEVNNTSIEVVNEIDPNLTSKEQFLKFDYGLNSEIFYSKLS